MALPLGNSESEDNPPDAKVPSNGRSKPNGRAGVSPRLETVLMVEDFIAANSGRYTRFQVWQRLPRKVMYQTYRVILSYLEASGKIATRHDNRIWWTGPASEHRDEKRMVAA
ncbi:MAG: hypothetical protein QXF55_02740 [Candidatus Aenigmatarchaeota archaeon]